MPDWSALTDSLAALYVEPDATATARVQVMTLHRAKGLEFDVVIMPGLARPPRAKDGELLLWRDRPSGLLLAPLKARTPDADQGLLYTYLRALSADRGCGGAGSIALRGLHPGEGAIAPHRLRGSRWTANRSHLAGSSHPRGTSLAALWPAIAAQAPRPPAPRSRAIGTGGDHRHSAAAPPDRVATACATPRDFAIAER